MPIMDGLECTRRICKLMLSNNKPDPKHSWLSSVPIIAMTANAFDDDKELCREAGMNDHIAKPIMIEVLQTKLMHWL